ncbi:hypothetical protein PENSPDRAFT_672426, partial [Peniophora sp. CONT]
APITAVQFPLLDIRTSIVWSRPGYPITESGADREVTKYYAWKKPVLGVCMGFGGFGEDLVDVFEGKLHSVCYYPENILSDPGDDLVRDCLGLNGGTWAENLHAFVTKPELPPLEGLGEYACDDRRTASRAEKPFLAHYPPIPTLNQQCTLPLHRSASYSASTLNEIGERSDVVMCKGQSVRAVLVGKALIAQSIAFRTCTRTLRPSVHSFCAAQRMERSPPLVKICGVRNADVSVAALAGAGRLGLLFTEKVKEQILFAAAQQIASVIFTSRFNTSTYTHPTSTRTEVQERSSTGRGRVFAV